MCNNYRLHIPASQLATPFSDAGQKLGVPGGVPNLFATDYHIGDSAPVVILGADGPQLTMRTWAWATPKGKPVFNFRSDDRSFAHSVRCLIPADGFYEFTEPKVQDKKTKWLFTMTSQPWFWIAGIIKDGAFAILTTYAGPDIAPYHDRQIVVLPSTAGSMARAFGDCGPRASALPGGDPDRRQGFPVTEADAAKHSLEAMQCGRRISGQQCGDHAIGSLADRAPLRFGPSRRRGSKRSASSSRDLALRPII